MRRSRHTGQTAPGWVESSTTSPASYLAMYSWRHAGWNLWPQRTSNLTSRRSTASRQMAHVRAASAAAAAQHLARAARLGAHEREPLREARRRLVLGRRRRRRRRHGVIVDRRGVVGDRRRAVVAPHVALPARRRGRGDLGFVVRRRRCRGRAGVRRGRGVLSPKRHRRERPHGRFFGFGRGSGRFDRLRLGHRRRRARPHLPRRLLPKQRPDRPAVLRGHREAHVASIRFLRVREVLLGRRLRRCGLRGLLGRLARRWRVAHADEA